MSGVEIGYRIIEDIHIEGCILPAHVYLYLKHRAHTLYLFFLNSLNRSNRSNSLNSLKSLQPGSLDSLNSPNSSNSLSPHIVSHNLNPSPDDYSPHPSTFLTLKRLPPTPNPSSPIKSHIKSRAQSIMHKDQRPHIFPKTLNPYAAILSRNFLPRDPFTTRCEMTALGNFPSLTPS